MDIELRAHLRFVHINNLIIFIDSFMYVWVFFQGVYFIIIVRNIFVYSVWEDLFNFQSVVEQSQLL